jgi:CHAT domain
VPKTVVPLAPPMRFLDFAIRAWREGPYLQAIAHATPAGSMRQPVATRLGVFSKDDYRFRLDCTLRDGVLLGRQLARLLFPAEMWQLFGESLQLISSQKNLGLRLRLCLDDDLIDLPWELLYRRDVEAGATLSGFILADARISLVREPASVVVNRTPNDSAQQGLFLGTFFSDGSDGWGVRAEYASLNRALRPLKNLISLKFENTNASEKVEAALAMGCSVFHYAGHVDLDADHAALVQVARTATDQTHQGAQLESLAEPAPWVQSDELATRLAQAGTRLAIFNAWSVIWRRSILPRGCINHWLSVYRLMRP